MASPVYNYYLRDNIPESIRNEIHDINKKITLQNKCFSILHKSQLTHNNTTTKLFTISYNGPQFISNCVRNTSYLFNTDNIDNIISVILSYAKAAIELKKGTITISIYTLNSIDYKLIDDICVLDMLASKKEILLSSKIKDGIDMQAIRVNNIPQNIIPLLELIATLNILRTNGNNAYIISYYKTHNLTPIKNKCIPSFIGKKKTMCINHCISNINAWLDKNTHTKQKTNTQMHHISIV
jgi:hypothetical protein